MEKVGSGHDTHSMLDMLDMALMWGAVSECALSQLAIAAGKITGYFNHLEGLRKKGQEVKQFGRQQKIFMYQGG